MGLVERIAQVEADLLTQRARVSEEVARLRGLEAELKALRAGLGGDAGLTDMSRTDAILTVLRQASGTMSPTELLHALQASGRAEDLRSVTATLDYLLKADRVRRPERGHYLAT
ncbi:hypothetical protein [Rhabdothermincola sp.]|uniref:hypothetical protein n=1 Tax=Rhabdothermincola sp. TaxID=2820405 RepID=UPI002FE04D30